MAPVSVSMAEADCAIKGWNVCSKVRRRKSLLVYAFPSVSGLFDNILKNNIPFQRPSLEFLSLRVKLQLGHR